MRRDRLDDLHTITSYANLLRCHTISCTIIDKATSHHSCCLSMAAKTYCCSNITTAPAVSTGQPGRGTLRYFGCWRRRARNTACHGATLICAMIKGVIDTGVTHLQTRVPVHACAGPSRASRQRHMPTKKSIKSWIHAVNRMKLVRGPVGVCCIEITSSPPPSSNSSSS